MNTEWLNRVSAMTGERQSDEVRHKPGRKAATKRQAYSDLTMHRARRLRERGHDWSVVAKRLRVHPRWIQKAVEG